MQGRISLQCHRDEVGEEIYQITAAVSWQKTKSEELGH